MTEITNLTELQAAIKELRTEVHHQENAINQKISYFTESLHPINILTGAFTKIASLAGYRLDPQKSLSENIIKTSLSVLMRKLFLRAEEKAEQNVADGLDKVIGYVKNFVKRKF